MPGPGMQSMFRQMSVWFNGPKGDTATCCGARRTQQGTKKLWLSTASGSDSRRLDLRFASGHSQVRKREWGWLCAPVPHYNPIRSACHFNLSTHNHCIHNMITHSPTPKQKSCGDGRVVKQQVWDTLEAVAADLGAQSIWSLSARTKQ